MTFFMCHVSCILEIDLDYPKKLHDLHSDYPLAPENVTVPENMLSPYSKNLLECLDMKPTNVSKLFPNLNNKTKYFTVRTKKNIYAWA